MDRATYDQLDRLEQNQEELKDVLYLIAEKLGISDLKDDDESLDESEDNKEDKNLDF